MENCLENLYTFSKRKFFINNYLKKFYFKYFVLSHNSIQHTRFCLKHLIED